MAPVALTTFAENWWPGSSQWKVPISPIAVKTGFKWNVPNYFEVDPAALPSRICSCALRSWEPAASTRPLRGENTHRLHVAPSVPVSQFWALTVYNRDTEALFVDSTRPTVGLLDEGMRKNADGSADLYVGPKAPDTVRKRTGSWHVASFRCASTLSGHGGPWQAVRPADLWVRPGPAAFIVQRSRSFECSTHQCSYATSGYHAKNINDGNQNRVRGAHLKSEEINRDALKILRCKNEHRNDENYDHSQIDPAHSIPLEAANIKMARRAVSIVKRAGYL
jgi:hypothetical protein